MQRACSAPIEYLRLVLQHGGDANLRHPEWREVPLEIADSHELYDRDARIRLLLEHGADATLMRAIRSAERVRLLLENDAALTHRAASDGHQ